MLQTLEEFTLFESKPSLLALDEAEVDTLLALGRELASNSVWWGSANQDPTRSVITAEMISAGYYRVTFRDVVGVVSLGQKQIAVRPKIPIAHFTFIVSRSDLAPRLSSSAISVDDGENFSLMLARWCVDAAEKLLRKGLRRDYQTVTDTLDELRGRIDPIHTAMLNAKGVPQAVCEFQEFSEDTSLNRVVKAACQRASRLLALDGKTRARARQVAYRMDDVGPVHANDLHVRADRLSASYVTVLPLALLVLSGLGISASIGHVAGTAFLVRTPELIEDGLRSILQRGLSDVSISKRRLMLGNSGLSINPDLVFGNSQAIGDVKYRVLGKDWSKPDFNQIVTFATGFESKWASLFGFSIEESPMLPSRVSVGQVKLSAFSWIATDSWRPEDSEEKLLAETKIWLDQMGLMK